MLGRLVSGVAASARSFIITVAGAGGSIRWAPAVAELLLLLPLLVVVVAVAAAAAAALHLER